MGIYYDNSSTSFEIPIPVRISFPFCRELGRYVYEPHGEYHADTYQYRWQLDNNDWRTGKNENKN